MFFFFRNRGCSWTPSNRVKNAIMDRVLVISDETREKMEQLDLDEDYLINVLNDGDVNFSKSDKNDDSKVYLIEKDGHSFMYTLPAESFISEVFIGSDVKGIQTDTEGYGDLIHFPYDDDLVFVDSNSVITCQQNALGLVAPREILKDFKENGLIDFKRSKLDIRPKPEHYILFKHGDKEIGANVIWYKNKLNILKFEFDEDNCGD